MEQQVEKVSFLSEPDSHLLSFFYRAVKSLIGKSTQSESLFGSSTALYWSQPKIINIMYFLLDIRISSPQFPNVEWTFRKASWLCNMFIWCNFFVLVTLTHLQVAVNQKECPFSRYLPLCVHLLENRYLKQDWVIEELSDKIEQSSNSKEYSCRASTNRVMHGSFLALQVLLEKGLLEISSHPLVAFEQ